MAETNLTVNLKPNTRELDRALKGKKIGVGGGPGGKEAASQKKQERSISDLVGISRKALGSAFAILGILSALDFVIKPLFSLLTAILTLLFLPLLPVFKPGLEALAKFIPIMAKFSEKATAVVQKIFDVVTDKLTIAISWIIKLWKVFAGFVKGIATLGLWVWTEIIKPGMLFLLDVGERIWNEILKPGFDFIKQALISAANAIIDLINRLPGVSVGRIGGGGGGATQTIAPIPNQSFPAPNQSFPTSSNTVTINNPIVREKSDIKKIADAVSKVLGAQVLRGGLLSLA